MGLDIDGALLRFINKTDPQNGDAEPTTLLLAVQKYGRKKNVSKHAQLAGIVKELMTEPLYDEATLFTHNQQMPNAAQVDAFFQKVAAVIKKAVKDKKLGKDVTIHDCVFFKTGQVFLMQHAETIFNARAPANAAKGEVAKVPKATAGASKPAKAAPTTLYGAVKRFIYDFHEDMSGAYESRKRKAERLEEEPEESEQEEEPEVEEEPESEEEPEVEVSEEEESEDEDDETYVPP